MTNKKKMNEIISIHSQREDKIGQYVKPSVDMEL